MGKRLFVSWCQLVEICLWILWTGRRNPTERCRSWIIQFIERDGFNRELFMQRYSESREVTPDTLRDFFFCLIWKLPAFTIKEKLLLLREKNRFLNLNHPRFDLMCVWISFVKPTRGLSSFQHVCAVGFPQHLPLKKKKNYWGVRRGNVMWSNESSAPTLLPLCVMKLNFIMVRVLKLWSSGSMTKILTELMGHPKVLELFVWITSLRKSPPQHTILIAGSAPTASLCRLPALLHGKFTASFNY